MSFFIDLLAGELAIWYYFIMLIVYILLIVAWWRMFEKAGQPGWASIIPFYNLYILYKISWGIGWLFILSLIPFVGFVFDIIMKVKLAKAFGYPGVFAVGLIFLPNIFELIMGFSNNKYIGVQK